jgi:monofunctional biosynthetic peptidoglycan transglycosylase
MTERGPDVRRPPELIGRRVHAPPLPRRSRVSWRRRAAQAVFVVFALPIVLIAVYRFVPPPITPLMVLRSLDGAPIRQHWVAYRAISPNLVAAVMASEDENFCNHDGFDLGAMREAWLSYRLTGRLRGASTISQQTAKNLFLWPAHSFVRKAIEAYLTVGLELLWPKRRILEVYLNIIEWGPGVYGAASAADSAFGRPAAALTRQQAALLAAVVPNPLHWSATHPGPYVERRAEWIMARMDQFRRGCG